MRDFQLSRPVIIALIGAVLVGGFVLFKSRQSDQVVPPATQVAAATPATGATGGSSGAAGGATGAMGSRHKAKKSATPATPATGATGGTGASGATGATGSTQTANQILAEQKAKRRAALVQKADDAGMPLPVYEAVHAGKEVMIFFWQPDAPDDTEVNGGILALEKYRGKRLVVFRDKISNKSKYDGIAQAAAITQTPGIVMLYKKKADMWQGWIDPDALNARLTRLTGYSGPSSSNDPHCLDTAKVNCK